MVRGGISVAPGQSTLIVIIKAAMRVTDWLFWSACLLAASACDKPQPKTPVGPARDASLSPLGPSYVLLPLPNEDSSILGRILTQMPLPGQALDEISAPNPCEDKLAPPKETPLASSFEDAQNLQVNAKARAALGGFGFQSDVSRATHFAYRLETQRQTGRQDLMEYQQCCKDKGCGVGYVATLVYGEGEYATAEETTGAARVDLAVAAADGYVQLKVIHRRKVRGYMAALVRLAPGGGKESIGALGSGTAVAGVNEETIPATVKAIYENNAASVGRNRALPGFVFEIGGNVVTENGFVRRYREVTDSDELDPVESMRSRSGFYGSLGTIGAGAGLTALALTSFKYTCTGEIKDSNSCDGKTPGTKVVSTFGISLAIVGGGAVIMGAAFAAITGSQYEGQPNDHHLSDAQARVYAAKYNRALLRKALRDVRDVHHQVSATPPRPRAPSVAGPWLSPTLGLGNVGIEGTF